MRLKKDDLNYFLEEKDLKKKILKKLEKDFDNFGLLFVEKYLEDFDSLSNDAKLEFIYIAFEKTDKALSFFKKEDVMFFLNNIKLTSVESSTLLINKKKRYSISTELLLKTTRESLSDDDYTIWLNTATRSFTPNMLLLLAENPFECSKIKNIKITFSNLEKLCKNQEIFDSIKNARSKMMINKIEDFVEKNKVMLTKKTVHFESLFINSLPLLFKENYDRRIFILRFILKNLDIKLKQISALIEKEGDNLETGVLSVYSRLRSEISFIVETEIKLITSSDDWLSCYEELSSVFNFKEFSHILSQRFFYVGKNTNLNNCFNFYNNMLKLGFNAPFQLTNKELFNRFGDNKKTILLESFLMSSTSTSLSDIKSKMFKVTKSFNNTPEYANISITSLFDVNFLLQIMLDFKSLILIVHDKIVWKKRGADLWSEIVYYMNEDLTLEFDDYENLLLKYAE